MKRYLALAVIALGAGLPAAAERVPQDNPEQQRLLAMTPPQRLQVLSKKVGPKCAAKMVTSLGEIKKADGSDALAVWKVGCTGGKSYVVFIPAKGSPPLGTVSCDELKGRTGYDCSKPIKEQPRVRRDGDYREIDISDLKLDRKYLVGRKLKTAGFYSRVGDLAALGSREIDPTPIQVAIEKLTRDKKRALQACEVERCWVSIKGKFVYGYLGYVLVSDDAEILRR